MSEKRGREFLRQCFITFFKIRFFFTKITMPLNSLGKPRWWCDSFGSFWVNYRLTCGCILRHTSNTASLCDIMRKSKEISQDVRKRIVVHSGVQFPDAWRCHVHLFKQSHTSINTMGMSRHHIAQEGEGFCVPEMNVIWSVHINPEPKHTPMYPHGLKGHSAKKPLLQKQHEKKRLQFANAHGQRPSFLETCPVVWLN